MNKICKLIRIISVSFYTVRMPKLDYKQTYPVSHSALQISRVSINRIFQQTKQNAQDQWCSVFWGSTVYLFMQLETQTGIHIQHPLRTR